MKFRYKENVYKSLMVHDFHGENSARANFERLDFSHIIQNKNNEILNENKEVIIRPSWNRSILLLLNNKGIVFKNEKVDFMAYFYKINLPGFQVKLVSGHPYLAKGTKMITFSEAEKLIMIF